MKKLTIEYSPASEVKVLRLPGWPKEPVVEARQDGRDTITLSVMASHPDEEWKFVILRGGVLSIVTYATRSLDERPVRMHFEIGLCIPPEMINRLRIDRSPARKERRYGA